MYGSLLLRRQHMPITSGELEFAKAAAEMATAILPGLKHEAEELNRRIAWHESNLATWEAIRPSSEPPTSPTSRTVVEQLIEESPRAKRGEAQDRVLRIMKDNPGIKAKDISKELVRQNGLTYPASTIYRIMELVKEKSKTPALNGG